jgi:hypothetical protein
MKFSEIANRLTGISTPLGGVSWQPTDLEVSAARRVIAFLEDRRVLYAPDSLEVPEHCVHSVLEIRRFLSNELGKLETGSEFAASLRAMRAACRKFLDRVGTDGREVILYADHYNNWASWTFYSALGEVRGTFGIHLAKIAAEFKLDIEDRLAEILPAEATESGGWPTFALWQRWGPMQPASHLFSPSHTTLSVCLLTSSATTALNICTSSPAVAIIGNGGWAVPGGVICSCVCSNKCGSAMPS